MSGMWKRSYGSSIATPPDERGGNSCDGPTATAPHLDSTRARARYYSMALDARGLRANASIAPSGDASGNNRPILLKVRQAKPGGVGSHVKENTTENF
jgi:hypothetical protein